MESKFWMITYSQRDGSGKQYPEANLAIDMHPLDWLMKKIGELPSVITVVHFAIEISSGQHKKAKGEL